MYIQILSYFVLYVCILYIFYDYINVSYIIAYVLCIFGIYIHILCMLYDYINVSHTIVYVLWLHECQLYKSIALDKNAPKSSWRYPHRSWGDDAQHHVYIYSIYLMIIWILAILLCIFYAYDYKSINVLRWTRTRRNEKASTLLMIV